MSNQMTSQLWIDKYHPKNYSELLTDERINREILTWMKSWDEIVFHKKFNPPKIPQIPTNEFSSNHPIGAKVKDNKQFFTKGKNKPSSTTGASPPSMKFFKAPYEIEYLQSKHKIILIAGPPGIGKTTLVSIISKQCGYEPIIVNASDERTVDKLLTRIYDTTLMQNINKTKKPTCLILDEIDGIAGDSSGKNSIKSIIDFIKTGKENKRIVNKAKTELLHSHLMMTKIMFNQENLSKGNKSRANEVNSDNENESRDNDYHKSDEGDDKGKDYDPSPNKSKKTLVKSDGIKRPIICVCNDVYAKSIALLRKEALVYNFKKTDEKKIIDRLCEICKKEHLELTRNAIKLLCEKTKYDIRATLNNLQFLSYNKRNSSMLSSLSSFTIGLKDLNENLFSIWNKLFFPHENKEMTYKETLSLFHSSGEFFKVIEGLFVNYLNIPNGCNEDVIKRAELTELFSYEDTISKKVLSSQAFELNNYMCLSGLYLNNYYSSLKHEKNVVEFPTLLYDYRKEHKANQRTVEILKENLDMNRRLASISCHSLIVDVFPFLYQLIQPEIREINPELMNKREIKQIKTSAALMLLCGLNFNESGMDDSGNYNEAAISYEPNIKRVLTFANIKGHHRLTVNQKFILKIEHEKMKAMSTLLSEKDKQEIIAQEENKAKKDDKGDMNSIMATLALKNKRKSNQIQSQEYRFIYKFHEGVTNCVKRPLNIKYFKPS